MGLRRDKGRTEGVESMPGALAARRHKQALLA
jgi:hypothetical protein